MVEGEGFEPSKAEPSDLQSDPLWPLGNPSTGALHIVFRKMVEGEGFEPSKAEPSDLQSDPFGCSGNPSTGYFPDFYLLDALEWWREKDSNLRRQSRQIYSLIPLAAREPLPKCEAAYYQIRQGCEPLGRILTTKSVKWSFFDMFRSKFTLFNDFYVAAETARGRRGWLPGATGLLADHGGALALAQASAGGPAGNPAPHGR